MKSKKAVVKPSKKKVVKRKYVRKSCALAIVNKAYAVG